MTGVEIPGAEMGQNRAVSSTGLIRRPMASVIVVKEVLNGLEHLKIDYSAALPKFQLPSRLDSILWGVLPADNLVEFILEQPGITDPALFMAEISHQAYGKLSKEYFHQSTQNSQQLLHGFKNLMNLYNQNSVNTEFWFEFDDDHYWFCRSGSQMKNWEIIEPAALALMVHLLRLSFGESWSPSAVRSISDNVNVFQNTPCFSGLQIQTRAGISAIGIARTTMAASQSELDELGRFRVETPPLLPLQKVVMGYISDRHLNIDTIASVVGLSTRSLQRFLTEQGTSFRDVLVETRFRFARYLLETTDKSGLAISQELGFSNQSNFNRGFRKIYSVSPSQHRARYQQHNSDG